MPLFLAQWVWTATAEARQSELQVMVSACSGFEQAILYNVHTFLGACKENLLVR